jgi:hypothetical protein
VKKQLESVGIHGKKYGLDSTGSGEGPVMACSEYDNEFSESKDGGESMII